MATCSVWEVSGPLTIIRCKAKELSCFCGISWDWSFWECLDYLRVRGYTIVAENMSHECHIGLTTAAFLFSSVSPTLARHWKMHKNVINVCCDKKRCQNCCLSNSSVQNICEISVNSDYFTKLTSHIATWSVLPSNHWSTERAGLQSALEQLGVQVQCVRLSKAT